MVASLVLAATVGLAACGDDGGGGGEETLNLTIGDIVPLTGDLSDYGPSGRKAAELAVDQINAAAKEAGSDHTVKVVHEDDQTDPQAAVQAARKVVDADNSTCIAGGYSSTSSTIPISRSVTIREGVLQLSPASTADEISGIEDDGILNRTSPPDRFQGPTLAGLVEEALGGAQGKTINIAARNDAYGTGLADTFTKPWEEKGGQIGERVEYDPEQPSYNSEAQQIVRGNPDGWVIIDFPETYAKVGPALVRTGDWDPKKSFITDGLASGQLPKDVGRDATEGMRGTAPGSPDSGEAAQAFDKAYEAAGGPDRQTFDAQNFDAVVLCYLAAVAAGSTDGKDMAAELQDVSGPGGDKYTFEQLPEAIEALQNGDDIDYEGASGPVDLNEDGDPTSGVYDIYRYKGGELEIYDELPVEEPQT
ncbi:MAG TPA: ABC transporter substrate-binding protein [Solirubrobacterales bacterium]|nr:ABC transporter substrate-binding protein [Solirubrobacterales bacterium]